jgi:hypothetical protein
MVKVPAIGLEDGVALIAVGPKNAILPTVTSRPHDERRGEQRQEDNRELDSPVSEQHSPPLLMTEPRPVQPRDHSKYDGQERGGNKQCAQAEFPRPFYPRGNAEKCG